VPLRDTEALSGDGGADLCMADVQYCYGTRAGLQPSRNGGAAEEGGTVRPPQATAEAAAASLPATAAPPATAVMRFAGQRRQRAWPGTVGVIDLPAGVQLLVGKKGWIASRYQYVFTF
jgi:hypothetical protein